MEVIELGLMENRYNAHDYLVGIVIFDGWFLSSPGGIRIFQEPVNHNPSRWGRIDILLLVYSDEKIVVFDESQ